jgi:predicted transposase YdaD
MIESAAYDIIKNEGIQEGMRQGLEEGMQQGLQKGLRKGLADSLITLMRVKFGEKGMVFQARIEAIDIIDHLRSAIETIGRAESLEDVKKFLQNLSST